MSAPEGPCPAQAPAPGPLRTQRCFLCEARCAEVALNTRAAGAPRHPLLGLWRMLRHRELRHLSAEQGRARACLGLPHLTPHPGRLAT